MSFPTGTYLGEMVGRARDEFEALYAQFEGWLRKQHKADGSHAAVTADSVRVSGETDLTGAVRIAGGTGMGAAASMGVPALDVNGKIDVYSSGGSQSPDVRVGTVLTGIGYNADPPSGSLPPEGLILQFGTLRLVLSSTGLLSTVLSGGVGGPTLGNTDWPFKTIWSDLGYYEGGSKLGSWTAVPHSAGNFTASTGTWTVASADQLTFAYTKIGNTLTVSVDIEDTDVSATPVTLNVIIPGGYTAAKSMRSSMLYSDAGGAAAIGTMRVEAGGSTIKFAKPSGSWSTATGNTFVIGQLTFEVE